MLTDWNEELVKKVNIIGTQIDESERTIETICMKLLLRQQPVAGDLLMIAKHFERIGDHCTNIAEWVEFSVTGIHKDCQ